MATQVQFRRGTTADRTITFPDAAGTVALLESLSVAAGSGLSYNSSTGQFGTSSIPNAQLANSTITIGSTAVALGSSITSLTGISGITTTGNITISNNNPRITFTEGDANPDYQVFTQAGIFKIKDSTAGTARFLINTDGHVDITNRLDALGGLAVTGDITVTGTVDGKDVATLATESFATAIAVALG